MVVETGNAYPGAVDDITASKGQDISPL